MQPMAEESMSVSVVKIVRYLGRGMKVVGSVCFLALASIIKITKKLPNNSIQLHNTTDPSAHT